MEIRTNEQPDSPRKNLLALSDWTVLSLAVLMIVMSLAQMIYRLSLPTEGWSFARDDSGTGQQLIFSRNLSGEPSVIEPGDRLVGVENMPYQEILARALSIRPQRPRNWEAGQIVNFAVERAGHILTLRVKLICLSTSRILLNMGRNMLQDPATLPMLFIAFFVFFKTHGNPVARLLLLFSAAVCASNGISQIAVGSNVVGPTEMFYPGAFWPAQVMNSLIWPLVIAPLYLHLILSIPVLKAPLKQHPRMTLAILYGFVPLLTLASIIMNFGHPLAFWHAWSELSLLALFLVLSTSIAIMTHTLLTVTDTTGRLQAHWVAWGILITSLGALSSSLLVMANLPENELLIGWVVARLLMLGFPVAVAVAILRYRLFDIDILINRTLVYSALTAILALGYYGSVILLQFIFRLITGDTSPVAIVLSTLSIAFLFSPLRRQIQNFVDRQFYRSKYNTTLALGAFSLAVRNEVELERLTDRLVSLVEDAMQPKSISLWLKETPPNRYKNIAIHPFVSMTSDHQER